MKKSKSKIFKFSLLSILFFMLSFIPVLFGFNTTKTGLLNTNSNALANVSNSAAGDKTLNTAVDLTPAQTTPTATQIANNDYRLQAEYLN